MNEKIINDILYLTHDKWEDKTIIRNREYFKEYLIEVLKIEPLSEEIFKKICEYGQNDDRIIVMKGVINIIKFEFPKIHRDITLKKYTEFLNKKEQEEILKDD